MAERQIIIRRADGKWSAAYSDQPEELFHGVTMQDAIDRLQRARGSSGNKSGPARTEPDENDPRPPSRAG
ncbi:MAG TPA: hypothetical protein VM510_06075 [Caulifigura sp.]|nr:hypothetical protein [Caulifigura sp.]